MEKDDLQYEPMRPDEQILGMKLAMALTTDEEILGQIDNFHESGSRCAAVVIIKDGEFDGGYVGNDEAIQERFPFPQVMDALDAYEPGETVCMIFQRGNLVSAGVVGIPDIPPAFGDFGLN